MHSLLKVLVAVLVVYAAITLTAYLGQRRLLYFPDTQRLSPASEGLTQVSEREIQTPDGVRLIAWYGKARPGQPTLLYFLGNGGGLADRAERIARFMEDGLGVYMVSYRGYSGSTGSPSEASNAADALVAYDALVKEGVAAGSIIAYGESLGSNIAVRVAIERKVGGVILDAPYTSILALAIRAYPYLPVRPLLHDRYETDKVIARMRAPLLILHGARDDIVPVAMGRALAEMANEPKRIAVFPNGGHSDLYENGALSVVRDWLRGLRH